MQEKAARKVTIFVSSPTDVMAERERAARVIDRLQSRFRDHVQLAPIFFEDRERYYTGDRSFQEQIPDAAATDLVISIFWSKLGSELAPDLFGTMPDGRPYPGGAVYELMRALEAKRQKKVPDIIVYRKIATAGVSVTDPDQRRLMNSQLDAFEAFWRQWFVSQEGHFRAGFQTFYRPDDFEHLVEGHLRAWLDDQGLLGKELIWRIAERGSPFRGLEPYETRHAEVFFGREREVGLGRERLLAAAAAGTAFLLVIGPSGAGKSSIARAGLASRLTQPGDIDGVDVVRLVVMRPGEATTPQRALADALFRSDALPELEDGDYPEPQYLAAVLTGEANTALAPIMRALSRLATRLNSEKSYDREVEARLVLVIDQLEELFATTVTEAGRLAFVRLVAGLARSRRVLVIATARSSSYGAMAREPELMALKDAGATLDVAVPRAEVLAEIVRGPAAAAGLAFDRRGEESLDEAILKTAGNNTDALPLLGFALQWLFENRDGQRLTFAAYDQLGGLEGAIGRTAEQAFGRVDKEAQATLPHLLRSLAEASRSRVDLALCDMPLVAASEGTPVRRLVDSLVAARVLVVHGEGPSGMYRLAHEAVLRGWDRARELVSRQQEFYRIRGEVTAAHQRWRDQRRNDLLLAPGLPLAEAQSLKTTYGSELAHDLLAFIGASVRKEQSRQRRGYALAGVFALVAFTAIGAGIFAWYEQRIAESQTAVAKSEASRAEQGFALAERSLSQARDERNRALLTQSRFLADLANQNLGEGDAGTAMLLALEGQPDPQDGAERPPSSEAEAALFSARLRMQEAALLSGSAETAMSAAFTPDGTRVVTASDDGVARIWDTETGRPITTLSGGSISHGHGGVALSFDGQRVLTSCKDHAACIWNVQSGELITSFAGDTGSVASAAFSPDGRYVVTASDDKTARIWDANAGTGIMILRDPGAEVWNAAFSPDGHRVLTSGDGTARIWNAQTGKIEVTLGGSDELVTGAFFNPDGQRVVTTSFDDNLARIWDTATGKVSLILRGHAGSVTHATFTPDGRRLATASFDHTARVWDSKTGSQIAAFVGHGAAVQSVAFDRGGRRLVTASGDNTARSWDATTGKQLAVLAGHTNNVSTAEFSPDGRRILTASWDGTARIWQAEHGSLATATVLGGLGAGVTGASFSADGRRILTTSEAALLWDVETGKITAGFGDGWGGVESASFSPDGRRILIMDSISAHVRDADTADEISSIAGRGMSSAVFSPDGRRVLTARAATGKAATIWDAQTAKEITILAQNKDVWRAAFAPDGRRVATISDTVGIWDAESGKRIVTIAELGSVGSDVEFSPDGRRLVTASSMDKTAKVWDATTGKLVHRF